MKKIYSCLLIVVLFSLKGFSQSAFTTGNLVVYKVGNGIDTLTNAGIAVNIDEYTKAGAYVRSHPLPVTLVGNNKRIIASGTATTEGQITQSSDKHFLVVTGYDTFPDPARIGVINANASTINRVVGLFSADGSLDATTALNADYSGSNIRGAASSNGIDIWTAGTGSNSGVRYCTKGSATATQLAAAPTNIRTVNIFNNQLYVSTGSGAFKAISAIGTGLPEEADQTVTVLSGMPNTTDANNDPYAFAIKPGTGDVAYLTDARSKNNGGGVQKWVNTGGNWSLAYTLDSGLTTGLRNIAVDWSTANPTIYCTSGDSYLKDMPGNKIVSVIDAGDSAAMFNVLATADTNYMFRGIAFSPEPAAAVTTYIFTGNGNWDQASNWANNTIPPTPLPASSSIVINHAEGGQCVLNVAQTLSAGSSFTVNAGKNLVIQGALTIQ